MIKMRSRFKFKFLVLGAFALIVMMMLPLTAAAVSNSEIIAILQEGLAANLEMLKVAFCASDVSALCP